MKGIHDGKITGSLGCNFRLEINRKAENTVNTPTMMAVVPLVRRLEESIAVSF